MKNEHSKRIIKITIVVAVLLFATVGIVAFSNYEPQAVYARPSVSGKLHVNGTKLCDEKNRPVILKGMSSHGIIYSPKIITEPFIAALSNDGGANLFRAAMYSYDFVERGADLNLGYLHDAVDGAVKNDMYVIIDGHTLSDSNPLQYSDNAVDFFRNIADKYSDCPNVIYEICNEPHDGTSGYDISKYANKVIPVIKEKNPDAVILCGTPNYCQNICDVAENLLNNYSNVMYTFHFYAGTHTESYRGILSQAIDDMHIPVFVSEFGLTDMSGDGKLYYSEAATGIDFMNERKIPYAMGSYSDLPESSSVFQNNIVTIDNMDNVGLKDSGRGAKAMLSGQDLSNFK